MITLRKLGSLKEGTRRRKFPLLFQQFEQEIRNGKSLNILYLTGLLQMIEEDSFYSEELRSAAAELKRNIPVSDNVGLLRPCNSIRHGLLSAINAEPGDWDFEETETVNRTERKTGNMYLFLDGIRSPFNVGAIFRTAESFGIKKIYLSRDTVSPEHRRAKRSSMGCIDIVPWSYISIDELEGPFFALELRGEPLDSFLFPAEGILIIGSEELGVSPGGLVKADGSLGRISIETGGLKGSINVSVATGIALQKWYSLMP